MKSIKYYLLLVLKGAGMGTANVIPGVSGGTVALITGIFEELIDSIKSFDLTALKLLFTGKFKEFSKHVNLGFLLAVFVGIGLSIITLAKLLDFLFTYYPVYIWAYFFGLIIGSVYFIGSTIKKWNVSVFVSLVIGTAVALSISFLSPASENEGFVYLMICGVVAICSMILPGISGSFVLVLMGNYQLVVIDAVNDFRIDILLPVILGAIIGLIAFSHLLSWIFKKFREQTIALLTGFILGSLVIIWPWKNSYDQIGALIQTNQYGAFIDGGGNILKEIKVYGYDQILPETFNSIVFWVCVLVVSGIVSIWLMEKLAGQTK